MNLQLNKTELKNLFKLFMEKMKGVTFSEIPGKYLIVFQKIKSKVD
jgi:hypothetical protein